jgi:hypothetical protein
MDLRMARARVAIRVMFRMVLLAACPLHPALCGARSPSRRYAGEMKNK